MGPRCTAVWQVRTNADRMICDDGKHDGALEGEK